MSDAIERLADELVNLSDEEWAHVNALNGKSWDELSECVAHRDIGLGLAITTPRANRMSQK